MIRNKTIKDICKAMGITEMTLLRWRKAGCPFDRVPRDDFSGASNVRFNLNEVKRWKEKNIRSR